MSENKELTTITITVSGAGEVSTKKEEPKLQKKRNVRAKKNETVYVNPDEGFDGLSEVQVAPLKLRTMFVSPSFVNQEIKAGEGFDGLDSVWVNAIALQDKVVTPSNKVQIVTADEGYDGVGYLTVNPAPSNTQEALKVNVLEPQAISSWNDASMEYERNDTLIAVNLASCYRIANFVLRSCVKLTDLYLPFNGVVSVDMGGDNDYQFGGNPRHITIHVPQSQIDAYLSDEKWQKTLSGDLVNQGFSFDVVAIS